MIPLFGIIGAATATALTMALWSLGMVIHVRQRLNLHPTVFSVILTPVNTAANDR
jgi:O-antigen/teichoic acid export membrane protein